VTESAGNLYALCLERSLAIQKDMSRLGMIVQQPVVSTKRMKVVRDLLFDNSTIILSSTFDDRPSKLFNGIHHARIAILLCQKAQSSRQPELFVSKYNKWYKEERPDLFPCLNYVFSKQHGNLAVFPKIGSSLESTMIQKLLAQKMLLGHWFTITIRAPRFFRDGLESSSTRESTMNFATRQTRNQAFSILNSSLFYSI